jgi:YfiH family protein
MPAAVSSRARFEPSASGGWWFRGWASGRISAGISDRRTEPARLLAGLPAAVPVSAEQVHGASTAVIADPRVCRGPLPGCDALITAASGTALLIRTADCLPIFFADASRGVVALAHAGWRGVAAGLPARVAALLRRVYHCRPQDVRVAIGPSIRACCYEVGPEFAERFGPFVRMRGGRRTCDLVGAALDQLTRCGIAGSRITDAGRCTACELEHWFSLRREGQQTGRLTSVIAVRG